MFDVIVIGAGVNGSSAAYDLKQRGKNVLLLEQVSCVNERSLFHFLLFTYYTQKLNSF